MYYTVIKHSPAACAFYISLMFSSAIHFSLCFLHLPFSSCHELSLHADRPISSGKQRSTKYRFPLRRGRNRIGRREKLGGSRGEGEIGSESREKGDSPHCSSTLL